MRTHLKLSIISPSGVVYKDSYVESITLNGVEGQMTILPNHVAIFSKLQHGEISIISKGEEKLFTVFQGFFNLNTENEITIKADNALRSKELNIESIEKAKKAAEKALSEKEKLSAIEILKAETAMRRAIMELNIAKRKQLRH